jgi:hypothetical protein
MIFGKSLIFHNPNYAGVYRNWHFATLLCVFMVHWINLFMSTASFIGKILQNNMAIGLLLLCNPTNTLYHWHLCDLLPPLVHDITNYPVRNRNDYNVTRCRLSLYQSSFILSVINLLNSLDNDNRNTRTFDTFKINLKSKVVLAKIPAHFLVGDRRHNIVYVRLRRSCSSLKYDLCRSNITTDSRCVCGFTREDASHFLLNCRLYIEQFSLIFCTTIIFGEI